MARVKTTGIVTTQLDQKIEKKESPEQPDSLQFQVVDVGGQRNERKKWIHCFDDVKAIVFCDNLAGYNQVMYEDSSKNRMVESLEIFSKLTHNPLFEKTPIFLFLNKRDLFEKMVTEVDMKVTFKDYNGGKDYKNALDFVKTSFLQQSPPNHEHIYVEVLTASWKREVRVAFESVKTTLYNNNKAQVLAEVARLRKQQKDILKARMMLVQRQTACCGQTFCCGRDCYAACGGCGLALCTSSCTAWSCFADTCFASLFCCCCPPAKPVQPQASKENRPSVPASPSVGGLPGSV